MGLTDRLFGKKKTADAPDPLADLVLSKLKVGYLVDHDLVTWQVTAYSTYKFPAKDDLVEEWEIAAGGDQRYLELADGAWSLSRKISVGDVAGDVRRHILDHQDPPETILFEGNAYHLDASYAGHMHAGGTGPGQQLIRWEFVDEAETSFVGIEQWGETEFTAAAGVVVGDHQFTHILPGSLE